MRGDKMRGMKNIMKITALITLVLSLFGCTAKPEPLDGPGMVYKDEDYSMER